MPVAVHGAIEKHGVECLVGRECQRVGVAVSAASPSRVQIVLQPREPPGGFVDGRDVRASGRELRRFSTGSGTKIEHVQARDVAEQLHGQSRRRVLHPPGALGVALEFFDAAGAGASHRPVRQHDAAETLGPVLGIGLDGQIERRLRQRRPRDLSCLCRSVGAAPSRQQPIGNGQSDIVERGKASAAAFARAPQHGVDEIGETPCQFVGAALVDRERNRGMRRRLKQKHLRHGSEQDLLETALMLGQRLFEIGVENGLKRTAIAQSRRRDQPRERTIAGRKIARRRRLREGVIEGTLFNENGK